MEKSRSRSCCGWFFVIVLVALIAAAIVVYVKKRSDHSGPLPVPGPPGAIDKKYANALKIAMQFLDVQKSGKLVDNKISWRGDSALNDGSEENLDLSKGMFDAGDHMKFGFPMAYSATILSWAILEYGDHMNVLGQLSLARDSLKWITDYLINAHPSDSVLFIQVGNPEIDHKCWDRPESMSEDRPLIQVNMSSPGTEVTAETAAAMASASLVFKTVNATYSSLLLKHAKQLFTFSDKYRGSYSRSVPQVQSYYNSTGYGDELLWAASWLYHATGDNSYLEYVSGHNGETFARWGSPTYFSWDNKLAGTQVLLSRLSMLNPKDTKTSALKQYRKTAESVMCLLLPESPSATSSRTDGGLIWISEWNSLQHPVASAFLALLHSDYMLTSQTPDIECDGKSFSPIDLRKFATSQADYVLGDNPMRMSYLVGNGENYPKFVHHRGASIPVDARTGCTDGFKWLNSTQPNPNVAMGALVGGPFFNETYIDSRNNSMQGEPTTYNNALLAGLLSGLVTTSSVVKSF